MQSTRRFKPFPVWLLLCCCLLPPVLPTPAAAQTASSSAPNVQSITTGEQLARALASLPTGEACMELLRAAAPGVVNADLWKSLVAEADAAREAKDYERALVGYANARVVADFLGDQHNASAIFDESDKTIQLLELSERAPGYREQNKRHDTTAVNPLRIAEESFQIGAVYATRGDYPRGMGLYQRSLAAYEQGGGKLSSISSVTYSIGAIHYLKGEYAEAFEIHRRSLKMAEESGDRVVIALSLFGVAADHRMQGDYALALEFYERSLQINEEIAITDKRGAAVRQVSTLLRHIGTTHYLQGNYALALRYFERCLRGDEERKDVEGIAYSLSYMAGVYRSQGRYPEALEYLDRSLRMFESIEYRDGIARTLATLGSVYQLLGDSTKALQYFERALELRERMGAKEGVAGVLAGIANVHGAQGRHAQALEASARAADLARRIGSRHLLWGALLTAGRAHRALGQPAEARRAFDESIATVEAIRLNVAGGEQEQEMFFADKVAPYYEMVDMLIREKRADEAFAYAEQGKARVLLDVLRKGRVAFTGRMTRAEQERERKIKNEMAALGVELRREQASEQSQPARLEALQSRLEQARLEHAEFQTSLYAKHPELRLQRGETRSITWQEAAELVPDEDTALIAYTVMDDSTHLFVFTKRRGAAQPSLAIHSINITRGELARRAGQFRQQLARGDLLFSRNARALYDLLLKPAEAELRGARRLVIVPDEALWELPFQALQLAEGHYLIERSAVSYAPSLNVLREMGLARVKRAGKAAVQPTLLAFGNPSPGKRAAGRAGTVLMNGASGTAHASLPEAERQVRALGALYGAARSRVYTGAGATEERLKREATGFSILHLATHGTLNDVSPMYSNIVLARGREKLVGSKGGEAEEDGLLEAWELMGMNLRAELVVLSACETARGRVSSGEGVIGMSWALFVAGSPTTVVSQWKVESSSTTELMLAFHRNLKSNARANATGGATSPKTPFTKAEALRGAALKLLRDERYAHPFYWAGFVLIGDS